MTKYLLFIGDSIKANATQKADLKNLYDAAMTAYTKGNERPSLKPTIWELIESPF